MPWQDKKQSANDWRQSSKQSSTSSRGNTRKPFNRYKRNSRIKRKALSLKSKVLNGQRMTLWSLT